VIPDIEVEEVRARADIVEIINEIVPLKKSGQNYKACCPFHEEKTPSFNVNPKGFYKCFGCEESGDVFSFLMKRMGMDFVDAVKHVAQRTGVDIHEVKNDQKEEDPFRHLYDTTAFARMFFKDSLWDQNLGNEARSYLEQRGIDREIAERFSLGFAPDEWRGLRDAASHHGIEDDTLLEVGLLIQSDNAQEPYDRFRGRITFSIEDLGGRVLGFGGRVLNSDKEGVPKYLNSPESPIYHKGETLYGLSWAKNAIRRKDAALVVEGYMDTVSLVAAGFDNTVAPLGTSLTNEQALLLGRYTTRVYILFDSDVAGLKATFRAGDILLAAGLHPSVVTLPPGEDPDTLVHKEGPEGLQSYIDQAFDVLDRKIQILEEKDHFSGIDRTRNAVDRLLPTLRAVKDPTLRDIYIAKVSDRTGVRRDTLEEELARITTAVSHSFSKSRSKSKDVSTPALPLMGPERELLLLMIKDRNWIVRVGEHLGPDDFIDLRYRNIFEMLLENPEFTHPPTGLSAAANKILEELLADPKDISQSQRVFEESLSKIQSMVLQKSIDEIDRLIQETKDPELRTELLTEKASLGKQRRELVLDWSSAARITLKNNR
tara:strand:+ start:1527 stop:3323 length:1797 start_codon:yes stop_codon:yes gene_type:complete